MKGSVRIFTVMLIPAMILMLFGLVFNAAARTEAVHVSDPVQVPSGTSSAGFLPQPAASTNYTNYLPVSVNFPGGCFLAPTLISPTNGSVLDTLNPLFVWDLGNNPNASYSFKQIAYDPGFTQIEALVGVFPPSGIKEFRYIFSNLDPGTTFYWRAWLECGDESGPYSEVWQFTTGSGGVILPGPSLISPANGSTTPSTVNFEWTPVTGAVEYLVTLQDPGPYGSRTTYRVADTQFQLSHLEGGQTYSWWVEARNDYAIGDASETWEFTTPIVESKPFPENCSPGYLLLTQPGATYSICTTNSD